MVSETAAINNLPMIQLFAPSTSVGVSKLHHQQITEKSEGHKNHVDAYFYITGDLLR